MFVTLLVSQLSGWLNENFDEKRYVTSVTRDVSHPEMCPCSASAAAGFACHWLTAACSSFERSPGGWSGTDQNWPALHREGFVELQGGQSLTAYAVYPL
jgi:hypothetical protein